MAQLNQRLRSTLIDAYSPCQEFGGMCHEMRWDPSAGHVPRGFCGASASLDDVRLVLVVAEPGNPHPTERHPSTPTEAIQSTYAYTLECFRTGTDLFHRNVRSILDLCWPDTSFDIQMTRTWITESVLCSAVTEGGAVRSAVAATCRGRYLDKQLALLPHAVVAALGSKAAKRMAGREFIAAAAAAPPGCNFRGARESWHAIASEVRRRVA